MKAILMSESGAPEVLAVSEIDPPEIASPTDVLVRIHAAGVNPVDTKLRSRGTYYPDRMPAVLGCDGAGTVEAVGNAVSRFQPGDEVYYCYGGMGGHQGNYAEYNVVDEAHLAKKPASQDFSHAGASPLVLITAWEALHDRAGMQAGQKVLIHAGAGGVGHVAIQLAKAVGCKVITTVSTQEKADFVRSLGADEVILYRHADFAGICREWSGSDGVDIAFDTVGGETFVQTFSAVRPYGHLVSLLQPNSDTDWKIARLRNLTTSLELMLSPMYFQWPEALRHQTEILERCATLFDEGKLRINLNQSLPLEQAAEAHRLIEQGDMQGKIVLQAN